MTHLATIKQIYVYPVKSMRGIGMDQAFLSINGLLGDRGYAFVQQTLAATDRFPWMTARDKPHMLLDAPRFERMPTPEDKYVPVLVKTPDGQEYEASDPRLCQHISALLGHPVFVLRNGRGNFDSQHVSFISLTSVAQLANEANTTIDPRQFRANLYIEPVDSIPFVENEWVGRVLQIGETARVGITKLDERCMMVNLDPVTAVQDPSVLRTVVKEHAQNMGIYGNVVVTGFVRVGDKIQMV